MAQITKQTVFMLAIYVVILIIMYSLVGINIQSGSESNKTVPWLLYGFSFIGAMGCFFALKKFNNIPAFKHKVRIIVYGIFLFALVTAALVLSKPRETDNLKIFTYCSVAIVFIINMIAGIYLIDSSIKVLPAVKLNNPVIAKYQQLRDRQGISPTGVAPVSAAPVSVSALPEYSPVSADSALIDSSAPPASAPPK